MVWTLVVVVVAFAEMCGAKTARWFMRFFFIGNGHVIVWQIEDEFKYPAAQSDV